MKNKTGFTLLELLVVVLIIGILAAIALPQYKVTIEKTKAAEVFTILQSMERSQQNYYLVQGGYTTSFNDLDISLPGNILDVGSGEKLTLPSKWQIYMVTKAYAFANNKSNTNTIVFYYSGKRYCYAKQNNRMANRVCEVLGGKSPYNAKNCMIGSCTVYTL